MMENVLLQFQDVGICKIQNERNCRPNFPPQYVRIGNIGTNLSPGSYELTKIRRKYIKIKEKLNFYDLTNFSRQNGKRAPSRLNCLFKGVSLVTVRVQKEAASRGSDWERKHIQAIAKWGYGYFHEARALWEELLGEKPNDLLALKMAHDANFFIGDAVEMRNSLARVLPQWKRDMPGYSYLHGMYAFGLEESGHYQEAEKHAVLALDMNRRDCWASHARAHVLEMTGRHGQGLQFLEDTEADWTPGAYLATHNFWHKALFHIELGKHQLAVDIFDQEVCPRTNRSCAMLDVVDASSLLVRLKMEGIEVGERWRRLPDLSSHATDHVTAFNDIHFGALFHGRGDVDVEQKMHSSLVNFTRSCDNDNAKVNQLVGQQLYEGVLAYMDEKYSTVVEKILPIRGDIVKIGGSHAQRDLFAQALVHACTRSTNPGHWELTPLLLKERAAIRTGTSPLAERILLHFREKHSL